VIEIRNIADIRALEARGYDAVFPSKSPATMLSAAAQQWPDGEAIRYLSDPSDPSKDQSVSFAEFFERIRSAAAVFRDLGVVPGRSVAILAPHTLSTEIALWGAELAGHVCPINPMLRPGHIAELLDAANVTAIVALGENDELDIWANLIPALRREGVNLPILNCDADRPSPGSDGAFEALISKMDGTGFSDPTDDDALAALYHTGGTTGAPKLVRHSHRNQAHVARSCVLLQGYGTSDVVVNGFPLFHVAGAFVYGLSALSAGSTVLIPGRLGMRNRAFAGSIWHQVERHGITVLGAVPTILSALCSLPVNADISTLRAALTGGSPLPPELAEAFEAHTNIPVRNILGMTETAGAIALESVHAPRTPKSCGFPLPFSEVAILDGEGDLDPSRALPPNETGVVAIRGPNVAAGYSDPARDSATFLEGGWLISGDLGHLDKEGRLFISGRAKDVIIRGSHNIDPQRIEDALLAHPDVETAAAVGMPDSYAGELPVAFVTLRGTATAQSKDLTKFLAHRIDEPAAMPKRIEIIDEMPVTPVGKIFKPDLRRIATEWALSAAAIAAGIEVEISAQANGEATICAAPGDLLTLRKATTGMPISIQFIERES